MSNLNNKVALITGGSKGIGYGIAYALMQQGVNVAVTSRSVASAEKAAEQLNAEVSSAKAIGLEADVRQLESQQQAVKTTVDTFGQLDIVIANAGLTSQCPKRI